VTNWPWNAVQVWGIAWRSKGKCGSYIHAEWTYYDAAGGSVMLGVLSKFAV
jgi:hypothetical protein